MPAVPELGWETGRLFVSEGPCPTAPRPGRGQHLHAVVVGAFPVEVAAVVVDTAVVQRAEAHEAVLQGVVAFLVHVVVPDHVLLAREPLPGHARLAGARAHCQAQSAGAWRWPQGPQVPVQTSPDCPEASTLDLGGNRSPSSRTTDPPLPFPQTPTGHAQEQRG